MANIQVDPHPHIHSGRSTHKYMLDLPLTTYPMAIVAMLIQFLFVTIYLGVSFADGILVAIQAGLVIFAGVFSCIAAESIWNRYVNKEFNDFAGWFRSMATTYPSITGMLYALSLPLGTPIYVVIIGGFVAIIIGKSLFGGVGYNIFNPALVGRAFVTVAYTGALGKAVKYDVIYTIFGKINISDKIDVITSASPLAKAVQDGGLISFDAFQKFGSIWDLLLGFYPSALGEGLSLYIILAFVYLSIKKTINWFVPVLYVGIVFLMTWGVGLYNGLGTPISEPFSLQTLGLYFPIFHVLTGGLLFGAVFMATEPVTSPITRRGRAIFAIYLAIITFAIRVLANLPEGVLYSILFMNMFVPVMDRFYMGQDKGLKKKEYVLWIATILITIGVTFYAAVRLGGAS